MGSVAWQRLLFAAAVSSALAFPIAAVARGGGHGGSHSSGHSHAGNSTHAHSGSHSGDHHKAEGVARDSHGRIARSRESKDTFRKQHPCPATGRSSGACPGYVIDHVVPLKRGGADSPSNMQWQTTAAAKAKDRYE
jgi:hypothetical protein